MLIMPGVIYICSVSTRLLKLQNLQHKVISMIHGAHLPAINTWPSKYRMCVISQHSYAGSKCESYEIMTKMFRLGETQHRKLERLELGSGVQGMN